MLIVPLLATPNQTVAVLLANQNCQLNVYQKSTGLYMDVFSNGSLIKAGSLCQNVNRVIHADYLGFIGDFWFKDTEGSLDPVYTGLGTRFVLEYLEAADLAAGAAG